MRKLLTISALFMALSAYISGCVTAQSCHRQGYDFTNICTVAVVDVVGCSVSGVAKSQIVDFFNMELLKKGFSPIERTKIQTLLNEHQLRACDITAPEHAAKVGKILDVPVILVINVPEFGEDVAISAKMLDVEDGSILWMGTGSGTTGRTTASILSNATVNEGTDCMLSPQRSAKVQAIIQKMCENLPSRCK